MIHRTIHFLICSIAGVALASFFVGQPHATQAAQPQSKAAAASDGDPLWNDLVEGNHRFMRGVLEPHPVVALRKKLAEGQHPKVGILACADSRVAPEIVFDKNLGDLFVVRVAGNVAEPLGVASLEYGVEHLGVKLLLVIGHESCGAVAAAASGEPMPTKNLTALVAAIRPAIESVPKGGTPAEYSLRQVEANVRAATRSLIEMSPVLRHELDDKKITILRCVYHLESGEVTRLAD